MLAGKCCIKREEFQTGFNSYLTFPLCVSEYWVDRAFMCGPEKYQDQNLSGFQVIILMLFLRNKTLCDCEGMEGDRERQV